MKKLSKGLAVSLITINFLYADKISLSQITVTAQKMEESINDIPHAITVIDETELEDKRIRSIKKLVRQIPNTNQFKFMEANNINF
ncbi:hypothetical protein F1B92_06480 [Campylobacter sp. FMV-PI01]|uniref:TonB-dependent receptor n=1 Tax=Campylobacter portucalensis TaxID=2608384 RepID=A0A6L5WHY9_9BACT|nr:hypothetical protein [Campylobacter portucalensis]MSN96810.1 hypothetical protein [Campylobacter portucalensis]